MLINQLSMYHEGERPVSVGFTVIFYRCVSKSCPPGQRYIFRAQLYLTKVSLRDLKYGSIEVEWSINIIKWP